MYILKQYLKTDVLDVVNEAHWFGVFGGLVNKLTMVILKAQNPKKEEVQMDISSVHTVMQISVQKETDIQILTKV